MQFAHWLLCGPPVLWVRCLPISMLSSHPDLTPKLVPDPSVADIYFVHKCFPFSSLLHPREDCSASSWCRWAWSFLVGNIQRSKVWFSMSFLPLCFKIYCINRRVDTPRERNNFHWKGSFPGKKGTWWLAGGGERESHKKHQGEEGCGRDLFTVVSAGRRGQGWEGRLRVG